MRDLHHCDAAAGKAAARQRVAKQMLVCGPLEKVQRVHGHSRREFRDALRALDNHRAEQNRM